MTFEREMETLVRERESESESMSYIVLKIIFMEMFHKRDNRV